MIQIFQSSIHFCILANFECLYITDLREEEKQTVSKQFVLQSSCMTALVFIMEQFL